MPRASEKNVNKDILEESQDNFALLISALNKEKDIQTFFENFLTKEEKTMLTKRLMLHLLLEKEYRVTEIASILGISRETIRVHKHVWSQRDETYKSLLRKIAKLKKTKAFWKKVEKVVAPFTINVEYKDSSKT